MKNLTLKIEKVGRKWIKAVVIDDSYTKKVKLHLDENTRIFRAGEEVTATFDVEYRYNKYFHSYDWELKFFSDENKQEKEKREKEERKQFLFRRIEEFLGYIEGYINKYKKPYWYYKGHEVIIDCMNELEKKFPCDNTVKNFVKSAEEKFDALYKKYKEEKEKYYDELEKDYVIYLHSFSEQYQKGEVLRGEDGKLYKVVSAGGHFEIDSMSFGGWERDGQFMYTAKADSRKVTEEDRKEYEQKIEEAVKKAKEIENREQERRKRLTALNKLKDYIKEGESIGKATLEELHRDANTIDDTFDIYGGGDKVLVGKEKAYYIRNNGGDGCMWELNTIETSGAGAYGWMRDVDAHIEQLLNIYEGGDL